MSRDVLLENEQIRTKNTEVCPQEMLAQVVDSVRRDSKDDASAFLAETTVPHGGE